MTITKKFSIEDGISNMLEHLLLPSITERIVFNITKRILQRGIGNQLEMLLVA